MDRMRIAISGSHATGKSSLLSELAARLPNLTVIDEPYHLLESAGHVFAWPPSADEFEQLIEHSVWLLEQRDQPFVAFDRCPADYLAYRAARSDRPVSPSLVNAAAAALATLDLVVVVPIEHPDRVAGAEAPRLRRRVDGLLREMLLEDAWGFGVPAFQVHGSLQARTAQLEARIAQFYARPA